MGCIGTPLPLPKVCKVLESNTLALYQKVQAHPEDLNLHDAMERWYAGAPDIAATSSLAGCRKLMRQADVADGEGDPVVRGLTAFWGGGFPSDEASD